MTRSFGGPRDVRHVAVHCISSAANANRFASTGAANTAEVSPPARPLAARHHEHPQGLHIPRLQDAAPRGHRAQPLGYRSLEAFLLTRRLRAQVEERRA